jgi:hypothetical protein
MCVASSGVVLPAFFNTVKMPHTAGGETSRRFLKSRPGSSSSEKKILHQMVLLISLPPYIREESLINVMISVFFSEYEIHSLVFIAQLSYSIILTLLLFSKLFKTKPSISISFVLHSQHLDAQLFEIKSREVKLL